MIRSDQTVSDAEKERKSEMKKNALIIFGLLISLVSVSVVPGKVISKMENFNISRTAGITVEQARKIALQRVEGTVQDQYTIEDEDENITTYVFVIKNKQGNTVEVQVDANNGNVLSVDERSTAGIAAASETTKSVDVEEAVETPEIYNNYPVETYVSNDQTAFVNYSNDRNYDNTPVGEIPPQFTIEQARFVAILKLNGEIQSEKSIMENGRLTYAFVIKNKQNQSTEVRVDAISGKARKIKNKPAKSS